MEHGHYFKDVSLFKRVDIYRVLSLWDVTDPCIQHAIKKLMCAGERGAKSKAQDIQEAIQTLIRYVEMREEEKDFIMPLGGPMPMEAPF